MSAMSAIFDEDNMMRVLRSCVPGGDTLSAGAYGIVLEASKRVSSKVDVYVGLTTYYLIVAECGDHKDLSEFYQFSDLRTAVAGHIDTSFLLSDIQICEIEQAKKGAVICSVTLKDGSFLQLQLPKRAGGFWKGLPHQAEQRDKIVARLSSFIRGS